MKPTILKYTFLLVVILGALTFTLYPKFHTTPTQHSSITETHEQKQIRLRGLRKQWDSQHFLSLTDATPDELAQTIETMFDPSLTALDQTQQRTLATMLAKQLVARAANIADPYLLLAQNDTNTRTITHSEKDSWYWDRLTAMYKYQDHPMPMPDNVDVWDIFRTFVNQQLQTNHGMLVGVADQAPDGFRLDVYKVHAADEVNYYIFQNFDDDQMSYWFENNGHNAFRVRVPKMSLDDILSRDHSATIVNICWLVQTDNQRAYNWHTTWYWDPKAKVWLCNRIGRKGWHAYMYY